jgi:hypothetical protein
MLFTRTTRRLVTLMAMTLAAMSTSVVGAGAATTGTISGTSFQDLNRNGIQDAGEAPFSGVFIDLLNSSGTAVTSATTDANGHYAMAGLADGSYTLRVTPSDWANLRYSWVPTSGDIRMSKPVTLSAAATVDFALRPVVRSTTPITRVTTATGTRIDSYDDVVSAQDLASYLALGTLFGAEAPLTTVRFDYSTRSVTYVGYSGTAGSYSNYSATSDVDYVYWLTNGDLPLFHEYGHAWSRYYSLIVQQDDTLSAYLQFRGLLGDSRLYSSAAWDPKEMIAEDYRQLFGSANAARYPQMNTAIPPASQISGLKTWLQTTFMTPPSSTGSSGTSTTSTTTTTTVPPVTVGGLSVNPQPVTKSATTSFSESAPATVTLQILTGTGAVARTLLASVAEPGGAVSTTWNRLNDAGKRVASGTYQLKVTAVDAQHNTATQTLPFKVS